MPGGFPRVFFLHQARQLEPTRLWETVREPAEVAARAHPHPRGPASAVLLPSLTFLDKLIFAVFALVSVGVWAGLGITHVSAWGRSGRAPRSLWACPGRGGCPRA